MSRGAALPSGDEADPHRARIFPSRSSSGTVAGGAAAGRGGRSRVPGARAAAGGERAELGAACPTRALATALTRPAAGTETVSATAPPAPASRARAMRGPSAVRPRWLRPGSCRRPSRAAPSVAGSARRVATKASGRWLASPKKRLPAKEVKATRAPSAESVGAGLDVAVDVAAVVGVGHPSRSCGSRGRRRTAR